MDMDDEMQSFKEKGADGYLEVLETDEVIDADEENAEAYTISLTP